MGSSLSPEPFAGLPPSHASRSSLRAMTCTSMPCLAASRSTLRKTEPRRSLCQGLRCVAPTTIWVT